MVRIASTPVTPESISALCKKDGTCPITEQVQSLCDSQIQQAINCCGVTSVAFALTALGYTTTVDDILLTVGIGVDSAVGDGMTLAEMHDASTRYVRAKGYPVFVECYHFDKALATPKGFAQAVKSDADAGADDLLVVNFHSGIAHGWTGKGGGHFSLLLGADPASDKLIVADVHAIKYGAYWSTPASQLCEAMADFDSCGRARGMLRFGRTQSDVVRPLPGLIPSLVEWTSDESPKSTATDNLAKYVPRDWDVGLGARNMEGASALSAAMRVLRGDDAREATLDGMMQKLLESYTRHLNNFQSIQDIGRMAKALGARPEVKSFTNATELSSILASATAEDDTVVMIRYNINTARGYELVKPATGEAGALSHGARSWSLIASYNAEDDSVVIAPAHNVILTGRLWKTDTAKVADAISAVAEDEPCVVIIHGDDDDGNMKQSKITSYFPSDQ